MRRSLPLIASGLAGLAIGVLGTLAVLQHAGREPLPDTPYSGQDSRQISSLSSADIAALRNGDGWGLAKPAELNGYPGPVHVLELADKLQLEPEQAAAVKAAFDDMNLKARSLGRALIDAEMALDAAFEGGNASPALISERLGAAERARAALRAVHLAAHLQITPILSSEQRQRYAELRGYRGAHSGHHRGHGGH